MWGWGFVDEGALRNAADKVSRHTVCQVELVSVSHHHCGYRADLGLSGFVSGSKSASAAAYSAVNPSCSVRSERVSCREQVLVLLGSASHQLGVVSVW